MQQRLRASGFRPWSDSLPVLDTRHPRKHHDDDHDHDEDKDYDGGDGDVYDYDDDDEGDQ